MRHDAPSVLAAPCTTQLHAWLTPFRYSAICTGPLLPAPVPCAVMARCAQPPAEMPSPVHCRTLCAPAALLVAAVSVTLLRLLPNTMDTHGVLRLIVPDPLLSRLPLPKLNTVEFCCPAASTGLSHAVKVIPARAHAVARGGRSPAPPEHPARRPRQPPRRQHTPCLPACPC